MRIARLSATDGTPGRPAPGLSALALTALTLSAPALVACGGGRVEQAAPKSPPAPSDRAADVAALLAIHQTVLTAHLEGKVEPWMATEADRIVQANNGVISHPEKSARAAGRAGYLARTRFTVYRDLREPIVTVSADGTLGWLLAEVEMQGMQRGDDGIETPVDATWAWIELYEKQEGAWRGVGNVSNRRPAGP